MTISSRTPEGTPQQCPVCGRWDRLEPCDPTGEFICPSCGHLFLSLRHRLVEAGVLGETTSLLTSLDELGIDSLDLVELIMELEEQYEVTIPGEEAQKMQTAADAIRYIVEKIRRREDRP